MRAAGDLRIGAVILAAGMSTRMGQAKQLVRLGDNSILQQTLRNVTASSADEIVLVLGFAAETIASQVTTEKVRVVTNAAYQEGISSSLREGLSALSPETAAALVVLADQPMVEPSTLNRIIDQYRHSRAQIVIPTHKGFRGNPVLLDRSVFAEAMALTGDVGCRSIFGSHLEGIVTVAVEDAGVLFDIDTKEDLKKVEGYRKHGQNKEEQSDNSLLDAATREPREMPAAKETPTRGELIIVGRERVAMALATLARSLQFSVTIVDPLLQRSELPEAVDHLDSLDFSHLPRNPDRAVVIASRGRFDEEAVQQALAIDSPYVGLVANKTRGQEVLHRLILKGESPEKVGSVHVPAGLDIGAEGAEEIALSILAEIISERRKRRAAKAF